MKAPVSENTPHSCHGLAVERIDLVGIERAGIRAFRLHFHTDGVEDIIRHFLAETHHGAGHDIRYHHGGSNIEIMYQIAPCGFRRYGGGSGEVIFMRERDHRALRIERHTGNAVNRIERGERDRHSGEAVCAVIFVEICESKFVCAHFFCDEKPNFLTSGGEVMF